MPRRVLGRAEGSWNVQDLTADAMIPLAMGGEPLPLAAIYDGGAATSGRPDVDTRGGARRAPDPAVAAALTNAGIKQLPS